MNKRILELIGIGAFAAFVSAMATAARADDAHHPKAPAAPGATGDASASSPASGEVKQIDKSAGKITIKHGPLANLDMPPMTMVFRVKDAAMLDQVTVGDKVDFVAEKVNGAFTVTRLEGGK